MSQRVYDLQVAVRALRKRLATAEAEANNAMVQSLDNEKTIFSLRLEVDGLRKQVEDLVSGAKLVE